MSMKLEFNPALLNSKLCTLNYSVSALISVREELRCITQNLQAAKFTSMLKKSLIMQNPTEILLV